MGLVQKIVEHLAAIDVGEVSVAELHVACILPRVQKGSHDDRFKVSLHHPPHAELLGGSTQFIQLASFAAPRVRQRFECYVEADLVPESEAVRNRASEAADPNLCPSVRSSSMPRSSPAWRRLILGTAAENAPRASHAEP
jgi:hypothetical protein